MFGEDERDAADLADLLRMGRLPEAWIAPPEIRELREITRYRLKLVGIRTSCKDQVHGVLAKLGVEVTCSDIFGGWGAAWLDELALPQPYAGKVASLRQLIAWLTGEIGLLDQVTAELLAGHEGYSMGVPGSERERTTPALAVRRRLAQQPRGDTIGVAHILRIGLQILRIFLFYGLFYGPL